MAYVFVPAKNTMYFLCTLLSKLEEKGERGRGTSLHSPINRESAMVLKGEGKKDSEEIEEA